jgi:glycosyltransferase involved in cell wall biosynthesis
MRILYIINDLRKGGAERYLVDLCHDLKNRDNINFIIATLYPRNEFLDETKDFTIVNLSFENYSLRKKYENSAYKNLIETFKPDVIHTHLFLAEFLSSFYVSNKVKYFCHGHDELAQLQKFKIRDVFNKSKITNRLEKQILLKKKYKTVGTNFIANSTDTFNKLTTNVIGNNKNKIKLIQYGFDFHKFHTDKEILPLLNKKIKILNVGSFQDKKNQIFIIEIAKQLRKQNLNFEINLVGHGANYDKIKAEITKNSLEEHVILHGLINNVKDWFIDADIYLHTAWYEPFGLVFLEAMASKTPIITLDGIGNRDLIENGKNGFIFKQQHANQFVEKIIELCENFSLLKEISEYAQNYAQNFNIKEKTDELISFYLGELSHSK